MLQNLNEKTAWASGLSWFLFLVLPLASWLIWGTKRQNDLLKFHTHKTGIMMLFCFLKCSEICGWKELSKTCYYYFLPGLDETAILWWMIHDFRHVHVVPWHCWNRSFLSWVLWPSFSGPQPSLLWFPVVKIVINYRCYHNKHYLSTLFTPFSKNPWRFPL